MKKFTKNHLKEFIVRELLTESKYPFDKVKPGTEIYYEYGVKYIVSKLYPGGFTMLNRTPGKKGVGSMFAEKTNMEQGNYESQVKLGFIKKVKY